MINTKSLIAEIKGEYFRLRNFLLREYGYKDDSPDIVKLDNLYKGLKDFVRGSVKTSFVHPAKIINYKASVRKTKITDRDKNTIAQAVSNLRFGIDEDAKSYYDSEGRNSRIKFSIESLQKDGTYRLKMEVDGEDIIKIIEQQREPQQTLREERRILAQYLAQVEGEHRYLDTRHLQIVPIRENSMRLERVYIRLRSIEKESLSEALYLTDRMKDRLGLSDELIEERKIIKKRLSPSISIEKVLQDSVVKGGESPPNILILGIPGSGKSCLLRYLVWSMASVETQDWRRGELIPFFIELGKYASRGHKGLIDYCVSEEVENISSEEVKMATKKILKELIEKYGRNSQNGSDPRIVFLLDALDEARDRKEDVVKEIEKICNRYKNALFIVTSRISGYYDAPLRNFTPYLIEDLQIEEISDFVKRWFNVLASEKSREKQGRDDWKGWAEERSNYLIKQIENNPRLKRIATSPFYLTFLVLLASDPNTEPLPKTQGDLLKVYFDKLILKWEEKHKAPDSEDLVKGFCSEDLLQGFEEISWIIHRALFGDIRNEPTEELIKKSIKKSVRVDPDTLLKFWINAGILLKVQTKNPLKQLILASHSTFLDYGFACKLAELWKDEETRKALQKDLHRHLHNENLYEPLLILIGKLEEPISFINYVRRQKDDLFHSNLIFLCELVREVISNAEIKEILPNLLSQLQRLLYSRNPFNVIIQSDICKCMYLLSGNEVLTTLIKDKTGLNIIIEALPKIAPLADKSAIPLLKGILKRVNDDVDKESVMESISRVEGKASLDFLLQLFARQSSMRRGIIKAIMISMRENAISILKRLREEFPMEFSLNIDMLVSIGELGEAKYALTEIKELLKGLDQVKGLDVETQLSHMINLAKGMAKLRDKTGGDILKQIYEAGDDIGVRFQVIMATLQIEPSMAIPLLEHLFQIEKQVFLQRTIVSCRAYHRDRSIIPYLKIAYDQTKDYDHAQRVAILYAFQRVASPSDIAYLKAKYDEARGPIRALIAYVMGSAGNGEAAAKVLKDLFKWVTNRKELAISEWINDLGRETLQKANLRIFNVKRRGWKLLEIPGKYTISSLSM